MISNKTLNAVISNVDFYRNKYVNSYPFPHIVIDDFMEEHTLTQCFTSIESNFDNMHWADDDHWAQKKKRWIQNIQDMPQDATKVVWWLNSGTMLSFLQNLTGIDNLVADTDNEGGGIHCTLPGGKLNVHVDFNFHRKLQLKRRLNAIIFLNKNWEDDWGGDLELWESDRSKCFLKIKPKFNRLVVFNTDEKSYHGVPEVVCCPEGTARYSIAMYYYTVEDQENLIQEQKRNTAIFY